MKSDFKEGRVGLAYKNGKLYQFTKRHVLVMTSWPDPRGWFKRRSHGWKATRKWSDSMFCAIFEPNFDLSQMRRLDDTQPPQYEFPMAITPQEQRLMEWAERDQKVKDAYLATIPEEIRVELARYQDRKWHVFNLLARCPGAIDLSRSNPALLYALASNWVFHKPAATQPIRAARRLVNKKQKVVMEWLGFPAAETVRRILIKIAPDAISMPTLLYLRSALKRPEVVKMLSHLEKINGAALRLVTNRNLFPYLTPRLMEDVSRIDDPKQKTYYLTGILSDTLKMAEEDNWQHCPPQFCSLHRLQEVHDDHVRRLNREPGVWGSHPARPPVTSFPPPPFAGTRNIIPIMTPLELYEEGRLMQHCVSIYAHDMADGLVYVYRVIEPVRATMMIRKMNYDWIMDQISGIKNASIELEQDLFEELSSSGSYVFSEPDMPFPISEAGAVVWHESPTIARCDLPEGQLPPLSWSLHNPKQLPLLSPEEYKIFMQCVRAFVTDDHLLEEDREVSSHWAVGGEQ